MTFVALLMKEMRLRMRRERTIWVIVIYILLIGLLGWLYISRVTTTNDYSGNGLSSAGPTLYYLLSMLQLFLIIFITPAFTATAVNGEKERQTYDLLLCSRLSALSLVSGKLVAGLANAFLLIAASVPVFSLVFFFGGVSPQQVATAVLIFSITTIMTGTFALFCSTLVKRPAISTAVAYMVIVLWILAPLILATILPAPNGTSLLSASMGPNSRPSLLLSWNPIIALTNTYPTGGTFSNYTLNGLKISLWLSYTLCNIVATLVFFLLSTWLVRPNHMVRRLVRRKKIVVVDKVPATS